MATVKSKFGPNQIRMATPSWAKWMFRITFLLTTVATVWVASTNLFPTSVKYEITLFLKVVIDPLIYGFSKMFGVNPDNYNKYSKPSTSEMIG